MSKFLAASLIAHLGALAALALATPFIPPIVIPAPEVSVALSAAPARAAPRAATTARRPPAPAVAPAEPTPTAADVSPTVEPAHEPAASIDAAHANHLRTLLYQALDRYFIYPAFAWRNGWEGKVDVAYTLDEYGRLEQLRVVHSSGYAVLDQDAVLTLQRIGAIPEARAWLAGRRYSSELPVVYKLIVD